jgi:hypothetical protein
VCGLLGVLQLGLVRTEARAQNLGREVALPIHLQDGDEFNMSVRRLFNKGERIFKANWTIEEGGGRPHAKGTGAGLSDQTDPLVFPRNFNRLSAPDANSCAGCHNVPFDGGGGDIVANVFVLGQRFDFLTFDHDDPIPTKGSLDESGKNVLLQDAANSRNTLGMFGSGFIEMLARKITRDLQAIRDAIPPGGSAALTSHGISFGTLSRDGTGAWDTSLVEGIPAKSLGSSGPGSPPSLIIRPFHQAGAVISLREFSNNAYNHHHGIQSVERFGANVDADQDGFVNELTIPDVTAVAVYQAALQVPGRVIPNDPVIEKAVRLGEQRFCDIGCSSCHMPCLKLDDKGWIFREPNPFNAAGNLRLTDNYVQQHGVYKVDLSSDELPLPRIKPKSGVVHVHAFTDLKLHDITSGPNDPNREALDMQWPPSDPRFFQGNGKFLTRKLWGCANEPPFFHHGMYTTMRQAIEAHNGEASTQRQAFDSLSDAEKNGIIEFLKTLQVLPRGTVSLVVDENFEPKAWPSFPCGCDDE